MQEKVIKAPTKRLKLSLRTDNGYFLFYCNPTPKSLSVNIISIALTLAFQGTI